MIQYSVEEDGPTGRLNSRVVRKRSLNRGKKNVEFVEVFKDIMKLLVLCGK